MHPKTRNTTRALTRILLTALAGGAGVTLATLLGAQGSGSRHAKEHLVSGILQYTRARIRENLQRLRMQKYIQFDERDPRASITLTERGMVRALRLNLRDRWSGHRRWDYLWRMVIFDIPEREKSVRARLRRTLQCAGFYPLQRSVFITPYACEREIETLCSFWQLRRCAHVFITASLGSAERRARAFFAQQEIQLPRSRRSSLPR